MWILPELLNDPRYLHSYNYAWNNPVNLVDPYGLIVPGDPDPSDEIALMLLIRKILSNVPWDKVIQVVKETLKNPCTKQIIRKFIYEGKTLVVLHEIWKLVNGVWQLIHRDFKGPFP